MTVELDKSLLALHSLLEGFLVRSYVLFLSAESDHAILCLQFPRGGVLHEREESSLQLDLVRLVSERLLL